MASSSIIRAPSPRTPTSLTNKELAWQKCQEKVAQIIATIKEQIKVCEESRKAGLQARLSSLGWCRLHIQSRKIDEAIRALGFYEEGKTLYIALSMHQNSSSHNMTRLLQPKEIRLYTAEEKDFLLEQVKLLNFSFYRDPANIASLAEPDIGEMKKEWEKRLMQYRSHNK